jgi:hypothetical protein
MPRGPLTGFLVQHLQRPVHALPPAPSATGDPITGEDAALALYLCYELSYRGFDGVDDAWEWEPSLLAVRRRLEESFLAALEQRIGPPVPEADIAGALRAAVSATDGPSLSRHMLERGTVDQLREFAIHRSAYQLKEADPHTWAIPRLTGRAKAAMVEIQSDEYGGGVEADMHCVLFAQTMRALGLDDTYGAYVDDLPGLTLSTCNLISLFGLHRRLRGAAVGHLTLFEMTSVVPMGRYSQAIERLGFGSDARRFYDVHVIADTEHQVIAVEQMAVPFAAAEPEQAPLVVWGAKAVLALEELLARHLLDSWAAGRSSLLTEERVNPAA